MEALFEGTSLAGDIRIEWLYSWRDDAYLELNWKDSIGVDENFQWHGGFWGEDFSWGRSYNDMIYYLLQSHCRLINRHASVDRLTVVSRLWFYILAFLLGPRDGLVFKCWFYWGFYTGDFILGVLYWGSYTGDSTAFRCRIVIIRLVDAYSGVRRRIWWMGVFRMEPSVTWID